MEILLTNDDGIHAPGLRALEYELRRLGHVTLVAPQLEQSGVGLKITYLQPLQAEEVFDGQEQRGWSVAGSPADCVKLGMLEFCPQRPDLVVSGINSGANVGINVLYSGTVAAAIEGAFFGVKSVAVSQLVDGPADYRATARRAVDVIRQICERDPQDSLLWNLNFPGTGASPPKGLKLTTLGVRRHVDVMERRVDPRGRPYFWSGADPLENHLMDPGTDVRELADGFVTLTPMHFDLTLHETVRKSSADGWSLASEQNDAQL